VALAVSEFAVDYADQNELDHAAIVKAARSGKIKLQLDA